MEKDLPRTSDDMTAAETAALRRLLLGFVLKFPAVGYCQVRAYRAPRAARRRALSRIKNQLVDGRIAHPAEPALTPRRRRRAAEP